MRQLSKSNKPLQENFFEDSQSLAEKPYVATTSDIQITIWPEFIDSKSSPVGNLFIWAYHVRIDNKSLETVQLLNRYWQIIDENGAVQEIRGDGVIGEQPIILPDESYQYSSGVHLRHPSGIMKGTYEMQKILESGKEKIFEVKIPTFSLDVPSIKSIIN